MNIQHTDTGRGPRTRKSLLRSISISAFVALSLTLTAAQRSAQAEEPPASIETITSLQGPSTALENGVKGFSFPSFFCTDMEKLTKDRQLQEYLDINRKWIAQIQEMVSWANSQRGRPVAAYYEREIRQVTLLKAKLQRIARAIGVKRGDLQKVPVKDCSGTATDVSMTTPETPSEPVDPLEGITFWQPRYYDASAPGAPGRICKEIDKLDYIVAVATARGNAGFNMNQADGVISDIEGHLRAAESAATRTALQAMLVTAKANLQKRIKELDEFDKLYAEAQKLKVEDCFANDQEAAMADPLDESQFTDFGTPIYVPDLKEVTLIELPAFVCDEDERGRLMAKATIESSKALSNAFEWQKRRDSIAEALRQGQGNTATLRQARYEADIEIGKREAIHAKTQTIFETARDLPLVDCSAESDDRTSMGPVIGPASNDSNALLSALNDMLSMPSPYTPTGDVFVPYPAEPDDALIYDAEDAVHDRQRDVHRHERWQERKDREKANEQRSHQQHNSTQGHGNTGTGQTSEYPKNGPAKTSTSLPQETTDTPAKKGESKSAKAGHGAEAHDLPVETTHVGPLGYPLKTGAKTAPVAKGQKPKEPVTPLPELVHEDLDYRNASTRTAPPKVYPPVKTTTPVLKAPSDYNMKQLHMPEAKETPKQDGEWVQVKPPKLVIQSGAADRPAGAPELY